MSKLNRLFKFSVNTIVLFCQKPGNGKVCLFKNQPLVFTKESIRYQNTYVSQYRERRGKKPFGIGSLVLLLVPVTTFGLGTWQVKRLKWKEDLIEHLKSKTSAPPIELPEDLSELENLEYRKVVVRGRFDHSKELFLGPKQCLVKGDTSTGDLISKTGKDSFGFLVVTPFILSDSGERILINRGWVKTKERLSAKRPKSLVEGEQTIVGVVRHTELKGKFTPTNKPELNIWYSRDIEEMAAHAGTLPVLLDATEESTIPGVITAGQTRVTLRNEHLSYILTWYSLSAATAFMWYKKYIRP